MYRILYFLQTDIICLIVLYLILITIIKKSDNNKSLLMFKKTIISCMLFCIFDSIIYCLQQTNYKYTYEILLIGNTIYFFLILIIGLYWNKFVNTKLLSNESRIYKLLSENLAILIGSILLFINLFISYIFEISVDNTFVIKDYMILLLVICWTPIITSVIKLLDYYYKTKSIVEKKQSLTMMFFVVFPFLCNSIQLIYPNLSLTQVGLTISMLLIFLDYQQRLISLDSLTGINNRNYLNEYIDNLYKSDKRISVFVLDIDKFKRINDTYGHEVGDEALKEVAKALKEACSILKNKVKLIRYGGDEFVIVGEVNESMAKDLVREINKNIQSINIIPKTSITLSIGYTLDKLVKDYTFKELLELADKSMYKDKNNKK